MKNKDILQGYNARLDTNNTSLASVLETVNELPEFQTIKLQDKEVTPTKETQNVVADENYNALNQVTVNPIPDNYIEPSGTLEITENGTYDVKEYAEVTTNVEGTGGTGKYAPQYISFYYYPGTDLTEELINLDTSNITDMTRMFSYATKIETLDLSSFDTSNVTSMSYMFYNATSLKTVKLPTTNNNALTNISYMFNYCTNLTTIDLSNFDTSEVTDMSSAFQSCTNLTTADLSNFDTSKVKRMNGTFSDCSNLTTLDLSSFDTSNVTHMGSLFRNCTKLQHLDIRNFTFNKVTSYSSIFGSSAVTGPPNDCLIIVKDDEAKTWITTRVDRLTNVKTVAELG